MVVVGAPSYFEKHARPRTPHDLAEHQCINLRLRTLGGFYAWEFEKAGRELKVRVEGQVAFNDERLIIKAARAGLGLAYVFGDTLEEEFSSGALIRVLADWTPPVRRLSSLLSKPPPAIAGFRFAGRGPSISQLAYVRFPPITDVSLVSAFDPKRTLDARIAAPRERRTHGHYDDCVNRIADSPESSPSPPSNAQVRSPGATR